jgi:DNA-binding response OmpR family regulator
MEKKTVLIVEDEPSLMMVLADKLSQEGFAVLKAINGQEGLDSALKSHPDLILLDLIMPVMDGITMLGKLRKDSWGSQASIIILSNLNDKEKITESVKKEVSTYMIKADWKLVDLVKIVKDKINGRSKSPSRDSANDAIAGRGDGPRRDERRPDPATVASGAAVDAPKQ